MRLFRTELRRLWARRLTKIFALLAVVGVVALVLSTTLSSHRPTNADRAQATAAAAKANAEEPLAEQRASCREAQAQDSGGSDFGCNDIQADTAENHLSVNTFRYSTEVRDALKALTVGLSLLGFLLGASFIGAEWSAGTLPSLLTWESRRSRVITGKAAPLAAALVVGSAVLLVVTTAALYGVASWRGYTSGTTAGLLRSLAPFDARGAVLVGVAALIGFGIAGILRNTSAALGLAFVYLIASEVGLAQLWHGAGWWLASNNVAR